ncbi:MAG: hypothetical protein ACKVP7_03850 [Hyphomicrobiaceae bacterium]
MRLLWLAPTRHLAWWWTLLTVAGCSNIVLWFAIYHHAQPADGVISAFDVKLMLFLCAAYVFGCAFRSFLPRADVQRFCLFDTWLSSVVVGRSVATVAEVCFSAQWALMLTRLGEIAGADAIASLAWIIVPMIVVAQCCSWYGVLTTNYLANAIENSIWAVAFFLVELALLRLLPEFDGVVQLAIIVAMVGIAGYLIFLVAIDVPMYVNRWRHGDAEGGKALNLGEGLRDAATRWIVTHDVAHWKGEMAWMSLYFTAAVWASLALCLGFSLGEHLPKYRTETSAEMRSFDGQKQQAREARPNVTVQFSK